MAVTVAGGQLKAFSVGCSPFMGGLSIPMNTEPQPPFLFVPVKGPPRG